MHDAIQLFEVGLSRSSTNPMHHCLFACWSRRLEEMLNKLQPDGIGSEADRGAGQGDNDPTTSTLHEAMERLHGQHLPASGEGSEGGPFMTPAGPRWPHGRSPPNEVNKLLQCCWLPVYVLCKLQQKLFAQAQSTQRLV